MSRCYQVTGEAGHRLIAGMDIHNIRQDEVGKRIDPFDINFERYRINEDVSYFKNSYPDLNLISVNTKSSKLALLAFHMISDGISGTDLAECYKHNGSFKITCGKNVYVIYGGKIYSKRIINKSNTP